MMKFTKGFTLIEMLTIIAIIGILATMVVVNVSGARIRARDTKRLADVKSIQNALEMYFYKTKTYPSDTNDNPLVNCGGISIADLGVELGPYLETIPTDPQPITNAAFCGAQNYWYSYDTATSTYQVWFALEQDPGAPLGNAQQFIDSSCPNGVEANDRYCYVLKGKK